MHQPTKFRIDRFNHCGDMAVCRFFKMASVRHVGFFKSSKLYIPFCSGRPMCVCMPNFVPIGQNFAEIWPIFDFSRWRPSAMLDLFYVYLDHPRRVFVGLCHCAKFDWNRCSSFNNTCMSVSMFCKFGFKMPIYLWVVFGGFDPLDGTQY